MSPSDRKPPATSVRLDADRIVSAALEVATEHGLDGMTMRLVGARLGADPTACYRYFGSKEVLIAAMADRLFTSIAAMSHEGTWRERLWQQARAVRSIYAAHPTIAEVLANQPEESPGLIRVNDIAIGCLREAGLTPEQIGLFQQSFVSYIIGNGIHEASWGEDPVSARAASQRAYAALDPAEYPHAASVASALFPSADDVFEFAVTVFLDAIEATAERNLGKRGTGRAPSRNRRRSASTPGGTSSTTTKETR